MAAWARCETPHLAQGLLASLEVSNHRPGEVVDCTPNQPETVTHFRKHCGAAAHGE
jgi:hypothetical protein